MAINIPDRVVFFGTYVEGVDYVYVDTSSATALPGYFTLAQSLSSGFVADGDTLDVIIIKDGSSCVYGGGSWDSTANELRIYYEYYRLGTIASTDAVTVIVTLGSSTLSTLLWSYSGVYNLVTESIDIMDDNAYAFLRVSSPDSVTLTLSDAASVGLSVTIVREGAGAVLFAAGTDQVIFGATSIDTQYKQVTAYKRSVTDWVITAQ